MVSQSHPAARMPGRAGSALTPNGSPDRPAHGADTRTFPRGRGDVREEVLPDGSVVLYDPRSSMGHALSESAAFVWTLCDGAYSASAIASELADRYDAPPAVILADVERLLQSFDGFGLLVSSYEVEL